MGFVVDAAKSVGGAIGSAASAVGSGIGAAASWAWDNKRTIADVVNPVGWAARTATGINPVDKALSGNITGAFGDTLKVGTMVVNPGSAVPIIGGNILAGQAPIGTPSRTNFATLPQGGTNPYLGTGPYGAPNPLYSGATPILPSFQWPALDTVSFGQPSGMSQPKTDPKALQSPNPDAGSRFPGGSALFVLAGLAVVAFLVLK